MKASQDRTLAAVARRARVDFIVAICRSKIYDASSMKLEKIPMTLRRKRGPAMTWFRSQPWWIERSTFIAELPTRGIPATRSLAQNVKWAQCC